MRFLRNLLRVRRYALIGLTFMFFGIIALTDFASAQAGLACDPDIPTNNPDCPNGMCRTFDANCLFLGSYCNDDPNENFRNRRWFEPVCDVICRGGRGVCEDSVVPCNMDSDCDPREQCLSGTCTLVESPPTPSRDLQCHVHSDCLPTEGCVSNKCTQRCAGTGTGARCVEDEGCYNGFCIPL